MPYREEGRRARHDDHHQPRAAQRALRLVRNHLGSAGDLSDALERDKDFAKAARLGLEFSEDFELTMPARDLMEVLKRLHGEAGIVLVESDRELAAREGVTVEVLYESFGDDLRLSGWQEHRASRSLSCFADVANWHIRPVPRRNSCPERRRPKPSETNCLSGSGGKGARNER